jgi:predicted RNA-binding protein with PIN domain
MEYVLIDGYNVINAWRDIFNPREENLEDCRIKLLDIISNYQGFKKTNVIVVFDAHMVKSYQHKEERYDNIKVVFTKENITADNYIERFVYRFSSEHKIRVVTSDYLEQRLVLTGGGIRVTPKEFRDEIMVTRVEGSKKVDDKKIKARGGNSIMLRIDSELLEKLERIRRQDD